MREAAYAPPLASRAARRAEPRAPRYVQGYILFQLLCQVALLSGAVGAFRVFVRLAVFGASLALLVFLRGRGKPHPAAPLGILAMVVLGFGLFHPDTDLLPGFAQAVLYLAILAPLFWVPRLRMDARTLRQTMFILWGFHTLSAGLGVLQVYMPGRFQPALSTVVASRGQGYVESLKITTVSGKRVFRPMGLTDVPGGAASSGLYAVLFGVGFLLTRRNPLMLAAAAGSMTLGIACLYLSQVRALLVMTAISVLAVAAVLAWRRDVARLAALGTVGALVAFAGWGGAASLAGPGAAYRMATLVRGRPAQVYAANRGHFLEQAFSELLPRYPMGAGLGRWGMMPSYFGDPSLGDRTIWVEIQWSAWIVDGGFPLMAAYCAAIGGALLATWRIARRRLPGQPPELSFWAAIVLAYGIGACALTFSYPVFVAQTGAEFWLLNATLFAAARTATQPSAAAPWSPT